MGKHIDYPMEELIPIVAQLTSEYSGYEHSSITYEKAQTLMEGVLYCINECANCNDHAIQPQNLSAEETYALGRKIVAEKVKELHKIYNELIVGFEDYGSECLNDTVRKGIPIFLSRYDVKYAPQETLLTLDYPVLKDLSALSGIDKVLPYMECIVLEQQFLQRFDRAYILDILESYHVDYRIMMENICGIVLQNMILHFALEKPPGSNNFTKKDMENAQSIFSKNQETTQRYISQILEMIIEHYYSGNMKLLDYLKCHIPDLTVRIPYILQNILKS